MTQSSLPERARPIVLIANPREEATRSFEAVFPSDQFDIRHVGTGALALAAARDLQPVAVIIDYEIPELDAAAVCRALVADPDFPLSTPIVITSDSNPSRAEQLATLRAGAWDFCVQPLNSKEFYQKIMAFVGASWIVKQARSTALVDDPGGVYSEPDFRRRAADFAAQLARDGQSATLVLMTMDVAPDPGGEPLDALDVRAAAVADCIRRVCRGSDVLAYLDPGEVAVLMREGTAAAVRSLVGRVRDCLTLRRAADPRLGTVGLAARFGKLPLRGNAAADLGVLIEEVRRAPPIAL